MRRRFLIVAVVAMVLAFLFLAPVCYSYSEVTTVERYHRLRYAEIQLSTNQTLLVPVEDLGRYPNATILSVDSYRMTTIEVNQTWTIESLTHRFLGFGLSHSWSFLGRSATVPIREE